MRWFILALLLPIQARPAENSEWRTRAIDALQRGNVAEARAFFQQALETDPADIETRRDLLWLLWDEQAYLEAATQAEQMLATHPDDTDALELGARAWHRAGHLEQALNLYRQALNHTINQPGLELEIVRILTTQHRYAEAWSALQTLEQAHPDFPNALPARAWLQECLQDYAAATRSWARVVETLPDNLDYAYRLAYARCLSPEGGDPSPLLKAILEKDPAHAPTRELLVKLALLRGEVDQAIHWLNTAPPDPAQPATAVPRLLRLAQLHLRREEPTEALAVLQEAATITPDHPEILFQQAQVLQSLERYPEAAAMYRTLTLSHPSRVSAWSGLATCLHTLEQFAEASEAANLAHRLDPTHPLWLLRLTREWAGAGETNRAQNLLHAWLQNHSNNEIPILLYHGLAATERDPMLASDIHLTTTTFRDQLQALHEAGYRTVSLNDLTQWLNGQADLPARSFLITFDDGRLDSLQQADPILADLGFQAVLFVAGVNADRDLPGYANWTELAHYQNTGRWQLQSHGDLASTEIPVDPRGLTGKFLPNRQWLMSEQRLESEAEWLQRIQTDHRGIQAKLRTVTGSNVVAYAWPEGNFGQQGYVNAPLAADRILTLTRESFTLSFHQDSLGINPRSRDPALLGRLEPRPEWTGQDLLQHLQQNSPYRLVVQALLGIALREKDAARAAEYLELLEQTGDTPESTLLERARLAFLNQDYATIAPLVKAFLELHPEVEPDQAAAAWNLLALTHQAQHDYAAALAAYEHSLSVQPDQPQTRLDLVTLLELGRDYPRAIECGLDLVRTHPAETRVFATLARLYGLIENHVEAASWWTRAAQAYPDQLDYPLLAGQARYFAGEETAALAQLETFLDEHPRHTATRDFLVRCALVRNDLDRALRHTQEQRQLEQPPSEDLTLRLANLYLRATNHTAAQSELRDALQCHPQNGEMLLLLGESLALTDQPTEAIPLFRQVLKANPWSRRAWLGLASAEASTGSYAEAVNSLQNLREKDPTDPYLRLREAEYLYAEGAIQASHDLLTRGLQASGSPVLPVLLYHGLTPNPHDPLLAHRIHHTVDTFADHLQQLHRAGYQSVTAAEVADHYAGRQSLPSRPILICFDDGRLDSLRYADPLLQQYGFRAVLFVSAQHADRSLPGYANWNELRQFQATGRWELQSHGDRASSRIPVDASGRQGSFLTSLHWGEDDHRTETDAQYRDRLEQEYSAAVDRFQTVLGYRPVAFAWPDGDFGQLGIPTAPQAAEVNLQLTRGCFDLAFHQDPYGQNPVSRDPLRLSRLEPRQDWSGSDLVRYLQDQNPDLKLIYQLIRQTAWQGRIHEASRWLKILREHGASAAQVATADALLHTMAGDYGHALTRIEDALQTSPPREARSLKNTLTARRRPEARLSFEYWEDREDRRTLAASLRARTPILRPTAITVQGNLAQYSQDGFDTSLETSAELSLQQRLNAFHEVEAGIGGHTYSGPGQDTVSYLGQWSASWTDQFRSGLRAEYRPAYTVQALTEDIRFHRFQADLTWLPHNDWTVRVIGRYWAYTDDNTRPDAVVQVTYDRPWVKNLQAINRFTYADTRNVAPAYYSPQQLFQNQLGLAYRWEPTSRITWRIRYLPGYGQEQGKNGRFVHALHTDLLLRDLAGFDLRPGFDFQQTPTYHMLRALLEIERRF